MQKFTVLDGLVAPMDRANVDTDAIIPKQFLKSIKRSGFGPYLFDEWRYEDFGEPGMKMTDVKIDTVFIGSCTNGRIEDLREVAKIAQGKKVAAHVNAMVVPGSGLVKQQAEEEGLDRILREAGFEWREPGCSMCLAMNPDKLKPGERCASTSNRNFEGRQGYKGRTHLVSPIMAAAAALEGHFVDVREWQA